MMGICSALFRSQAFETLTEGLVERTVEADAAQRYLLKYKYAFNTLGFGVRPPSGLQAMEFCW